tara:strand:+ start:508 stop:765 length:258 start_codon:yes stop_codon:yes gene_type:complete
MLLLQAFRDSLVACCTGRLIDSAPQMHEEEPTKYVTYERFEARALEMMREGKYAPDSEETILAAFKVSVGRRLPVLGHTREPSRA